MNHARITDLVGFNAQLQIAHWQADSITNTHRALGDLYERMIDFTDDFAEVALGKDGDRAIASAMIGVISNVSSSDLLIRGFDILEAIRAELEAGEDDDLLNIVADMSAALNKAKYLLRV